jgi:hypothetical protein
MKKNTFVLVLVLAVSLGFSAYTIQQKVKDLVVKKWVLTKGRFKEFNGTTNEYKSDGTSITIGKMGSEVYAPQNGTWKLSVDDKQLTTVTSNREPEVFDIVRLTSDSLVVSKMSHSKKEFSTYVPVK